MEIMDLINAAGGLNALSQQVGLNETQTRAGAEALLPAILNGMQQHSAGQGGGGGGGLGGLLSMLNGLGGGGVLDNVVSPEPTDINQGNNILGQILGSKDVSRQVAQQASQQTGLDPSILKKMLPILAMLAVGVLSRRAGAGQQGQQGGGLGGVLGSVLGGGGSLTDLLGAAGQIFGRR